MEGLGYKNPTPWVDEAVEALKFAKPGIIRDVPSVVETVDGLLASATGL